MEFELTEIEKACGVTLRQVELGAKKAWVQSSGSIMDQSGAGPALAGAIARYLSDGLEVEFEKIVGGMPRYRQIRN